MEFLRLEQGNLSVREYATKFEELTRFCPYTKLEANKRSKCSKFESGLKPKLKTMLRHQEITDFSTLVNKCRMIEDDMKADEVVASRSLPPKNSGPQRNFVHGRVRVRRFRNKGSLIPCLWVIEDILHMGQ
ncbi:putative retrotransposon gag domain-containing protein [Lupinus albus]|uniref:Putative retrotransposon gag domain-containing protein n=1 Tax=Lupinus albus TaxID=3870 RepID=A0A6A4NLE5_LUPAL|nr:putative retrotransposon gag domain-containing protein [Lupinus albus]